jgi:hypothetical protein
MGMCAIDCQTIQLAPISHFSKENCNTGGVFCRRNSIMQAALAERSTQSRNDLCRLAWQCLEAHPHFRGRCGGVSISQEGRNLYLTGRLPTFYLKQLVQEAVRHVPGVQFIYNHIDVVNPIGMSSARE